MFFDKGVLYVLEYGTGWYDVKNGRLLRVSYSREFNQQVDLSADPVPARVQITSLEAMPPGSLTSRPSHLEASPLLLSGADDHQRDQGH